MNSSDTRVTTYLDDLARMLSDIDPGERDEVLAGIREHLEAEIGSGDGGDAAVQAALLRLGPPERVAAEARAGGSPSGRPQQRHHPVWNRVAVIASMVAILPLLVVPLVGRVVALGAGAGPLALAVTAPELIVLLAPAWALSILALLLADQLPVATRSRLATLGPVALIGSGFTSVWWSPEVLSSLVTIALLGAILVVTVWAGRQGWREASA